MATTLRDAPYAAPLSRTDAPGAAPASAALVSTPVVGTPLAYVSPPISSDGVESSKRPEPRVAISALPGLPTPSKGVSPRFVTMQIRADRGGTRTVRLPERDFELVDGAPRQLQGPSTKVRADKPIYSNVFSSIAEEGPAVPSMARGTIADEHGAFVGATIDPAQTTAFFAAQSVHDWAARTAGRPVHWGDHGNLEVIANAWVTSTPSLLNAMYSFSSAKIMLGTYGAVRDGKPVPYSGLGIGLIDEMRKGASDLHDAPERERRLGVLSKLEQLAHGGRVSDLMQVLDEERPREPKPGLLGLWKQRSDPFAGREPYFVALQVIEAMALSFKPVENAFYDTASDRKVVAHEAGHAALFAMKPGLKTPAGLAFHEGFGDFAAMATTFDDDAELQRILEETHGDLSRSNSASIICERIAATFEQASDGPTGGEIKLRDASQVVTLGDVGRFDALTATDPKMMPETHELGRVFASAFYGLFAERADAAIAKTDDKDSAVRAARDETSALVHDAILLMPESGGTVSDIAQSLLAAARWTDANGGRGGLESDLRYQLSARELVTADAAKLPASMQDLPEVRISADTAPADILRNPALTRIAKRWALKRPVLLEDTTTERGLRLVRFEQPEAELTDYTHKRVGAFVFDKNGQLIAASGS